MQAECVGFYFKLILILLNVFTQGTQQNQRKLTMQSRSNCGSGVFQSQTGTDSFMFLVILLFNISLLLLIFKYFSSVIY